MLEYKFSPEYIEWLNKKLKSVQELITEKIGEILHKFFYGKAEDRKKLINKYNIVVSKVNEDDNNSYNISSSDSLFLITVEGRDYLVDIPWNMFYSYEQIMYEEVPESVLDWHNF